MGQTIEVTEHHRRGKFLRQAADFLVDDEGLLVVKHRIAPVISGRRRSHRRFRQLVPLSPRGTRTF